MMTAVAKRNLIMRWGELLYVTVRMDHFNCRVGVRLGVRQFDVIGQEGTPLHGMDLRETYGPGSLLLQIENACRAWFVVRNLEAAMKSNASETHEGRVLGTAPTSRRA